MIWGKKRMHEEVMMTLERIYDMRIEVRSY